MARRLLAVLRYPASRAVLAVIGVVVGGGFVVFSYAVGHCAFVGGTCPDDPVPWWQNDVFGGAAVGLALMVATPVLARLPNRRGLAVAFVAAVATLPVAWLIAEAARTGR